MEYRFGNAKTNPIRDWTHLIFDKQSLAEDMIARGNRRRRCSEDRGADL
jgi:hypothetical protein